MSSFQRSFHSRLIGCFAILFLACAILHANVKMPSIFSDDMVLQRDIPLNVWGWASPSEKVTVSFAGQTVSADADKNGKWEVKLNPVPLNKDAQEMTVSGKNKLIFKNVLVGDVWVCSGQSNMQMAVNGVLDAGNEIASSNNLLIRQIKINTKTALYPKDDVSSSKWTPASPQTVAFFTAAGYFFAREIAKEADVPVGLINTSWGGTRIEPWISEAGFRKIPELKSISEQVDGWISTTETGKKNFLKYIEEMKVWIPAAETALNEGKMPPPSPILPGLTNDHQKPTMIFNAMVNPIIRYGIKGAIWYQGESNGYEGGSYAHKMNALISDWRSLWKQGDFPFYFVQLANYQRSNPDRPEGGDGWAKLREAQLKTLSVVPNTGMAVIIDIGDDANIHPENKQDVGKRLAAWALAKDYGKNVVPSGPLYKGFKVEGNKIRISFDHIGNGLIAGEKKGLAPMRETPRAGLKSFAIAGADKKWYWADAVIDGDTVLVACGKVPKPIAVRYAFSMNPPQGVNLYNKEGLPASPFRTDSW
ncbi:MAG: hypothetical protein A2020_02855 [Lentisphaerae bacterium GWF2_45_14]|nr:MAG: hypothetical protein A2020_02855 [Lentisphaerae bacterium GWF2_45_14]